jgi:hypothetical protein
MKPNLELTVAVNMKCYRKYKMAEVVKHYGRPLAYNHTPLTTRLTASSSRIEKFNSVHKLITDKKYSYDNIPNELTANDKTLQNGGTTRAQKWQNTKRQFANSRIVICVYKIKGRY